MTMPHLMNCSHSEDGWCLDCVKKLWDETYGPRTLYWMIKEWRSVSIEKRPDDMVRDCNSQYVDKLREKVGPDCIIISFSGAESGLCGWGCVAAIDEKCNVIASIGTYIS